MHTIDVYVQISLTVEIIVTGLTDVAFWVLLDSGYREIISHWLAQIRRWEPEVVKWKLWCSCYNQPILFFQVN